MTVYRRLARSKKGMSTIFGGLFFVIIILMGFNVMLWGFIQYDAYNHVITSMSQRDQQAVSENLIPVNATYPTGGPLSVIVNNLGGSSVSIAAIYFDFKSFNYTQGSSGPCSGVAPYPSCPAFCMPSGTPVILYLRVANTSTNSTVTLRSQTAIQAQGYGTSASGLVKNAWIEASNTVNPSTNFPYVYPSATDYVLQPSGPNGPVPASFAIVKMGGGGPNAGGAVTFGSTGSTQNLAWITFIGIYYLFNGQPQGETIPFMDFVNNAPNCVQ